MRMAIWMMRMAIWMCDLKVKDRVRSSVERERERDQD